MGPQKHAHLASLPTTSHGDQSSQVSRSNSLLSSARRGVGAATLAIVVVGGTYLVYQQML